MKLNLQRRKSIEMALNKNSGTILDEEDFLEFEVNTTTSKLLFSGNAPPELYDFEFHVSSSIHLEEIIPTPADQLFGNGKILPFQHIQAHTTNSSPDSHYRHQPISSSAPCSCRQSSDLKFDDHFIDYEISHDIVIDNWPQQSQSGNMKQHFLGRKLHASREYLKSLFRKTSLFASKPARHLKPVKVEEKSKDTPNTGISEVTMKTPRQLSLSQKERHSISTCDTGNKKEKKIRRDSMSDSRRSLSAAINRLSKTTRSSVSPIYGSASISPSSSSSSFHKSERRDINLLRDRSSFTPETERAIAEAILHCKQTQMPGTL
uniref:Uncharacterized protein n=1 Tax=Kalanchoe fedtschenkoi TaxID=63787 RepID=A0A7N0VGS6_KALFE